MSKVACDDIKELARLMDEADLTKGSEWFYYMNFFVFSDGRVMQYQGLDLVDITDTELAKTVMTAFESEVGFTHRES